MRSPYSRLVAHPGPGGNPVVLGRKFCTGCGRWRHLCDFPRIKREVGYGARPRCWGCQRRYLREVNRNMTSEQRERKREYRRIWQDAVRRRKGVPARPFVHRRTAVDRLEWVFLEREPLVKAMDAYVARELRNGRDSGNGLPDLWMALAAEAGLQPRVIHRIRTGESKRVRLDVADKIAVALDVPLAVLYP